MPEVHTPRPNSGNSQSDVSHDVVVEERKGHRKRVQQRRRHRADTPRRLDAFVVREQKQRARKSRDEKRCEQRRGARHVAITEEVLTPRAAHGGGTQDMGTKKTRQGMKKSTKETQGSITYAQADQRPTGTCCTAQAGRQTRARRLWFRGPRQLNRQCECE